MEVNPVRVVAMVDHVTLNMYLTKLKTLDKRPQNIICSSGLTGVLQER